MRTDLRPPYFLKIPLSMLVAFTGMVAAGLSGNLMSLGAIPHYKGRPSRCPWILCALNKPEDFALAIVSVDGDVATPVYVRRPLQREPDFGSRA